VRNLNPHHPIPNAIPFKNWLETIGIRENLDVISPLDKAE